jgi:hypothetical protein
MRQRLMTQWRPSGWRQVLAILAGLIAFGSVLLCSGCQRRPVAPALRDDPVYQNDREGVRFLVPEGWKQYAKAEVPSGKVDKERLLVQYKHLFERKVGVEFEVSLADLPPSTDLSDYLAAPSHGGKNWRQKGPVEKLDVNGVAAERFVFTGRVDRGEMIKEVVVFQRNGRFYFFTGLFAAADKNARAQVRAAVDSTKWKK